MSEQRNGGDAILNALIAFGHRITIDEVTFYRDASKDSTTLAQLCDSLEVAWAARSGEDARRLDWLEQQGDVRTDWFMADGKRTCILRGCWGQPLGNGPTLRAAVDYAMNEARSA